VATRVSQAPGLAATTCRREVVTTSGRRGPGGGRPAREQAVLGEDARDVRLHRLLGDAQLAGDGPVRSALGHQIENVPLPLGQLGEAALGSLPAEEMGDDRWIEHLPALATASQAMNQAVSSTAGANRCFVVARRIGTGVRAARSSSAAASPLSVRTTGLSPLASSRRSPTPPSTPRLQS
jgi:hypothetical protein